MTHDNKARAAVIVAALVSLLPGAAGAAQSTVSYNLAPGACSAAIIVPANNKPVMVMGTQIGSGYRGEGYATVLRDTTNKLLEWAGTDYFSGNEAGFSYGANAHMFWLDYSGYVDVQTATSTHIKVCSSSSNGSTAIGYLTFMY